MFTDALPEQGVVLRRVRGHPVSVVTRKRVPNDAQMEKPPVVGGL